jgi:hypothetical protein
MAWRTDPQIRALSEWPTTQIKETATALGLKYASAFDFLDRDEAALRSGPELVDPRVHR